MFSAIKRLCILISSHFLSIQGENFLSIRFTSALTVVEMSISFGRSGASFGTDGGYLEMLLAIVNISPIGNGGTHRRELKSVKAASMVSFEHPCRLMAPAILARRVFRPFLRIGSS